MRDATKYEFEYPVPLYRSIVCHACKKGFDTHQLMFDRASNNCRTCPKCGATLAPLV